jgi:hypothetical protein
MAIRAVLPVNKVLKEIVSHHPAKALHISRLEFDALQIFYSALA